MKIGVLGGGLCGVVFGAYVPETVVIEADSRPGGHCKSEINQGYCYDIGGPHIIFSKNESILSEMKNALGEKLAYGNRDNRCWYGDQFLPYPFENGISELPPEERYGFVRDFFMADQTSHPKPDLKGWLLQRFGNSLANEYLIPYNEKIWNIPADQLTSDWVEGRIPMPSTDDMLKVACGIKTIGYAHQAKFIYPTTGGIEELVKFYANQCKDIRLNERVERVVKDGSLWIVNTSQAQYEFDSLVSTIPIHDLLSALPAVPQEIREKAGLLKFNSLINVAMGYRLQKDHSFTAIYIPTPDYLSHRISFPRNFSKANAPEGMELVNLEITVDFLSSHYHLSDDGLKKESVRLLNGLGLLEEQSIEYFKVHKTKHAYVVRDRHYEKSLRDVLAYLDDIGIRSLGRNAEFEYINMDEAIRRTRESAKSFLN
jgi:protoporphyrinogen oxidase